MLSKHHLLLSLAAGTALLSVSPATYPWWFVLGLAAVIGVFIDLDHFLLARLARGDWRSTTRALRNPRLLLLDQTALFEEDTFWARQRLLSHAIVGSTIVGLLLGIATWLAVIAAVTLWVHIVADLIWDNYHRERDFRRHARSLGFDA